MEKDICIEVSGLSKKYQDRVVLENIDFQVEKGTFCALLGENGAGKSTLLNILMGHEYADHGVGKILDTTIDADYGEHKNRIGLVTEKINYQLDISVEKFISHYGKFFKNFDYFYFNSLMEERKLDIKSYFSDFSRGQKMQVALISALAIHPEILLIDEITSVLDIYARKYFMEVLKKFTHEGGTVLITTNIISEVQNVTDKLVILNNGRIQLSEMIADIPSKFIKVRKVGDIKHPLFEDENCFWCGNNSDGSASYVIPVDIFKNYEDGPSFVDRRSITLDDIFIYFIKTGDKEIE